MASADAGEKSKAGETSTGAGEAVIKTGAAGREVAPPAARSYLWNLRGETPPWLAVVLGAACVACCLTIWWWLTRGEAEERIVPPLKLRSPAETFGELHSLWFEAALARQIVASLIRVILGFSLAALIGVPLGVLCGCFSWLRAFFAPLTAFGRNIPMAAVIGLTIALFGIDETQKVMFIFFACVAFIVSDTATAVASVGGQYIDTAYTLGASRRQVIIKVLFPLAAPAIFDSLRLLFGLAFGYIMLAEQISTQSSGALGQGLGNLLNVAEKRNKKEYILLILMFIPLVALAIDRVWFEIQKQLFPYRYGGPGWLRRGALILGRWLESARGLIRRPASAEPFRRTPREGAK